MFSKEDSARIRKEFWISFGKSFPRKWLLYDTKIKGLEFKFYADRKKAGVCVDFDHPEDIANELLFDQFISLKTLLEEELPDIIFDESFELESRKIIRRIYIPHQEKFSIYNKDTWKSCYEFYCEKMSAIELFFYEYEDFINQAI